jgi:methyl-accepting chemotaxis protein
VRITARLVLSFLLVSILPLTVVCYAGLQAMARVSSLAMDESTQALKRMGEETIRQKALGVAQEIELYLKVHPELSPLSPAELEADEKLQSIAVQTVGTTGYTAVYDETGVVYFHSNPALVGRNMHDLASDMPAFWAIFNASLNGSESAGYYDWKDAKGSVRAKYMNCVTVENTGLRVAATTYIDEFYLPIRATEAKITATFGETYRYLLAALIAVGLLAVGVALRLAWWISRPISHLIAASEALEQGTYHSEGLAAEVARRDDLGYLARIFDRMAGEVKAREDRLRSEVFALRIEVDEAKKARQVAEITETEYFQQLQKRATHLRARKKAATV